MIKEFAEKVPIKKNSDTVHIDKQLTVIRNCTLEPFLDDALYFYQPQIEIKYQYFRQCLLTNNAFSSDVFIILHLPYLFEDLYFNYFSISEEEIKMLTIKQIDILLKQIDTFISRANNHTIFMTLFVNPETAYVFDGQDSFESVADTINYKLIEIAKYNRNFILINSVAIAKKIGIDHYFDVVGGYTADLVFSRKAINYFAHEIASKISQNNLPIKCIVLDCDNVLWGGIIDEVGTTGIMLSHHGKGRAFLEFQREIMKLKKQGLLICVCSKNDEKIVRLVFDTNPNMLIKWSDLCAKKVSFTSKSQCILELSQDLNLPIQEMLFIDDNPYEITEVSSRLNIQTILLDPSMPHKYIWKLYSSGCFYKDFVSKEVIITIKPP